jgi:transaldolase
MEIWLETANLGAVQKANRLGVLHGIFTNPSIVARSGLSMEDLMQKLLDAQKGPVTAQVVSSKADEMIRQGEALFSFSNRIFVKVPMTCEGLHVIYVLTKKKIPVIATAVFDLNQTLLAARAGAVYISPCFSNICEAEQDGINELRMMVELLQRYHFASKILATSLRSTEQLRECAALGIDAVTLNETLFDEYVNDHPATLKKIKHFDREWKGAIKSKLLF